MRMISLSTTSRPARQSALSLCIVVLLGSTACSSASQPKSAAPSRLVSAGPAALSPAQQESAEDRAILATSKAIRQAHLTDLKDQCLAYNFDPHAFKDAYLVEVRENHRHAECGGDPQTQPRLFSVKIDKATQKMWTDKGTPGRFHPLNQ